ncbi:hypothetical protein RB597_003417 [Gaeumannomyces tritici]
MAAESQAHPSGGASGQGAAPLSGQIKALTFDVFGTVVDWRTSIEAALTHALAAKVASPVFPTLPPALQARARELLATTDGGAGTGGMTSPRQPPTPTTWPAGFAAQWRASYGAFTRGFEPGVTPWRDRLGGRGGLVAATLSNGNRSLLRDLDAHGALGFDRLLSSEDFGAYKPHPSTYLGAAGALGLRPDQVAMVAAHLKDLVGARACGLRTIYVERLGEEEWDEHDDRYKDAREWVDIWIPLDSDGFLELARRLGDSTVP